ncbi:MAG: hypothetical protein AB7F22_10460 [Reyranella sp.]|uniref:hypothetical protein n=1 Tax=Reyranella sp. TaxID=1929291 RepID=UPI003D0FDF81
MIRALPLAACLALAPFPAPAALVASEDACAETRTITLMVVTPAGPVLVHVIACTRRCYVEPGTAPDCRTDAARRRINAVGRP